MRRRPVIGGRTRVYGPQLLSAIGALMLASQRLFAQGPNGRIEGQIQDTTGAPISQAQIYIPGTVFGALSDPRGHYFINYVPAGRYNLRATYLGYRPVEARDLQVLAGQSIDQDFVLTATPLVLQEIEVVAAANLLVPRDEVTTRQRVQGEFLERLPVDRLNSLLALQPGVVATGQTGPLALSIRGGRPDEVVSYVDGVPVTPGYRGLALATPGGQISVGTNAVEEASVTTGTLSAEYGNAQSGVVSVVTRSGGSRFGGALAYQTDAPFGVRHSLGFNRLEASLGGPLASHLTFFLAGVLDGQQSAATGKDSEHAPVFVLAGIDTTVPIPSDTVLLADTTYVPVYRFADLPRQLRRVPPQRQSRHPHQLRPRLPGYPHPVSGSSRYELAAKLSYSFGAGSRLGLSYLRSQDQARNFDYATSTTHRGSSAPTPGVRWSR